MSKILLNKPSFKGNEWKYVQECIDTEWVSSAGGYVELFEKKIAKYTKSKNAIACVNGTSALQLSLKLAGVISGDEVIVPTLTFIAPINAIMYNNANPIFMDSDDFYNINIDKTINFINNETYYKNGYTYNKKTHNRISAIIPVHVWGNAVFLDDLVKICNSRNIMIIEDASESLGTVYKSGKFSGKHTGTIGKFGCLSFNGNKIITTGGGGMILTDDDDLACRAKYLTTQAKDDPIRYIHNEIGYNFRLTNIQAALGVAQLERLPEILKRKKEIYQSYIHNINNILGLKMAKAPDYSRNNHWLNILQINKDEYGKTKDFLMEKNSKEGIQTRPVWYLNHLQKPYLSCMSYNISKAQKLVENSLCLPSSTDLSSNHINRIIKELE